MGQHHCMVHCVLSTPCFVIRDVYLVSVCVQCVPVSGMGFRRGSYRCQCKQGFYFPNTSLPEHLRHFNGSDVERDYERMLQVSPQMTVHRNTRHYVL